MTLIKLIIFISALLLFTSVSEAKKRCKPLLERLHNIQAMQRNGYSSQRGLSLRKKEDKARDKWWQCEQGRGRKAKTKTKSKVKGKSKNSQTSVTYKQNSQVKILAGSPFKTNNVIVIKSKYQGHKKQAWIKFYQQPAQCNRPKSLAVFASCSEDKQAQRSDFEQKYE
jgi:hypothetical protein